MSVRVKICGITSQADAESAVAAGADALGFMFYPPSPRHLSWDAAAEIVRAMPPFVSKVAVFVNPAVDDIFRAIHAAAFDTLQFHGEEPGSFCAQFSPLKIIKALRVRNAASLKTLPNFNSADAWLLDSYVAGVAGGTGAKFNWELAVEAKQHNRPIILAGGLTPENVAEAIRQVKPFAVDVSTGVEIKGGKKDPEKMRAFIQAAKSAG